MKLCTVPLNSIEVFKLGANVGYSVGCFRSLRVLSSRRLYLQREGLANSFVFHSPQGTQHRRGGVNSLGIASTLSVVDTVRGQDKAKGRAALLSLRRLNPADLKWHSIASAGIKHGFHVPQGSSQRSGMPYQISFSGQPRGCGALAYCGSSRSLDEAAYVEFPTSYCSIISGVQGICLTSRQCLGLT